MHNTLFLPASRRFIIEEDTAHGSVSVDLSAPRFSVSCYGGSPTLEVQLEPELLDAIAKLHAAGAFPHQRAEGEL